MNVLIVDDTEANRRVVRYLLAKIENVQILEAFNGREGVDICASKNIDLVLMDIMMPVMDGIEATKLISALDPRPMIVAMSALDDTENQNLMLSAGAQDYIVKPINSKLFLARIKNYQKILTSITDKESKGEWSVNPFASKVYSRKILFRVTKESSIAEFWEFFLLGDYKAYNNLCNCVRSMYNAGLALLKSHKLFEIIVEENDLYFYFTVTKIEGYNKNIISKIFEKDRNGFVSKFTTSGFSIKFKKEYCEAKCNIEMVANEPQSKSVSQTTPSSSSSGFDYGKLQNTAHADKIDARSFLRELEESYFNKIDSLESVEDQFDCALFNFESCQDNRYLGEIANSLSMYADVIYVLHEFENICQAIQKLSNFLLAIFNNEINNKKQAKILLLLKGLQYDLVQWRNNIFVNASTIDIHYLDSSLISSCMQIDSIFNENNQDEDDMELELF